MDGPVTQEIYELNSAVNAVGVGYIDIDGETDEIRAETAPQRYCQTEVFHQPPPKTAGRASNQPTQRLIGFCPTVRNGSRSGR